MLKTNDLTIHIESNTLIKHLKLDVKKGDVVGVIGKNGVGKTTLLHTLAGIHTHYSGKILWQNQNIKSLKKNALAKNIGLLLQNYPATFPASVLEVALQGRFPHRKPFYLNHKEDILKARRALSTVSLLHAQSRALNALSGGEKRRLYIAMLLTQAPLLYLLDEPLAHLDIKYQMHVLNYFINHAKQHHCAIIMTMHDVNLVSRYCNQCLMLYDNGEFEYGETNLLLTPKRLEKLYQQPFQKIANEANNTIYWQPV